MARSKDCVSAKNFVIAKCRHAEMAMTVFKSAGRTKCAPAHSLPTATRNAILPFTYRRTTLRVIQVRKSSVMSKRSNG